jgi:mxaA protein
MSATTVARVALLAAVLCLGPSWAAPPPTAVVIQPRPTGYFVGDLVTQRILLEGSGRSYRPSSVPPPGRVNSWFERRRDALVTDESSRHWLLVEYQLLNAPKAVTAATLPAWRLSIKATDTAAPLTLDIPAVSLNIAPLSPPGSPEQVGTRDLRPDHFPPDIDTLSIRHALAVCATGLALTLAAWLAWVLWRNRRACATQPFAHALRELRTLPDDEPRAWQILHRAFDRTAGCVIQNATLPVLFDRAPHLTPARAEIEAFFAQSTQRFFATPGAIRDRSRTPPAPRALCQVLRRIEKRHEQ